MQDERYAVLAAEIERQNVAFAEVKTALSQLEDVELQVPQAFLEQLDELAAPKPPAGFMSIHALRG